MKLKKEDGMNDKAVFVLLAAVASLGIVLSFYLLFISLGFPRVETVVAEDLPMSDIKEQIVYLGVVSRFPPPIIYEGYQPIADYLTDVTDYKFELRLFPSYKETVESLARGEISAAFLGSQIYIEMRDELDIIPILKPLNSDGEPFHRSALITSSSNKIDAIDLNGKTIALPSEEAFASVWFNARFIVDKGFKPAEVKSFNYHHSVLFEVLKGNYDFGVVKDRVALEYLEKGVRIVLFSEKIPSSPIVSMRNYDVAVIDQLMDSLLNVKKLGGQVSEWDFEFRNGFSIASESDYSELAKMSRGKQ